MPGAEKLEQVRSQMELMIRRFQQTLEMRIYPQILPVKNGFLLVCNEDEIYIGKTAQECVDLIQELRSVKSV